MITLSDITVELALSVHLSWCELTPCPTGGRPTLADTAAAEAAIHRLQRIGLLKPLLPRSGDQHGERRCTLFPGHASPWHDDGSGAWPSRAEQVIPSPRLRAVPALASKTGTGPVMSTVTCSRCSNPAPAAAKSAKHCNSPRCPWWLCAGCRKLLIEGRPA